jgi:hypothetical protein
MITQPLQRSKFVVEEVVLRILLNTLLLGMIQLSAFSTENAHLLLSSE